jgi:hypothetical protein
MVIGLRCVESAMHVSILAVECYKLERRQILERGINTDLLNYFTLRIQS